MSTKKIFSIQNFGPIARAQFRLADITVLVGPQATGKSLALQWFKLAVDQNRVLGTLSDFGREVGGDPGLLAGLYFGSGYRFADTQKATAEWNGKRLSLQKIALGNKRYEEHSVLYIPAHRALLFHGGSPTGFRAFGDDTPFVARAFSEMAHKLLSTRTSTQIFPPQRHFRTELKERLDAALFHGGRVVAEPTGLAAKQLFLSHGKQTKLSMMEWTTGQREVLPLLLGLQLALPAGAKEKRPKLDYIIVEEPELGLHPDGVMAVVAALLEVVHRGYKLIISTHSSDVLEALWTMQHLKSTKSAATSFLGFLGIRKTPWSLAYANSVLRATQSIAALSLSHTSGKSTSIDITSLDPFDEGLTSDWGGLIRYASRASQIIAESPESEFSAEFRESE